MSESKKGETKMQKVIDSFVNKLSRWDWEDTWALFGLAVATTIVVGVFYGLGMYMFGGGETRGYYIDTYSYYERDANYDYVVLDSTTMQKNTIVNFSVKSDVSFSEDPIILKTRDAKEAQDLFFKLTSRKMSQHLRTQSIAELYQDLPFDEKVEFLSQIKMLNIR